MSNYTAPDGYRYGVMFGDGSVSNRWNGRSQRERAEEYLRDLEDRLTPAQAVWQINHYSLARKRVGESWERVPTYRTPPEGWVDFGTHVDSGPLHLLFSNAHVDGLPRWEKPCPGCPVCDEIARQKGL